MNTAFNNTAIGFRTPVAFHPGEILLEEVEERGIKKADFAKSIGLLPGNLSDLFRGKRNINARIALKIENSLGISAKIWIDMQTAYDLMVARELEYAN